MGFIGEQKNLSFTPPLSGYFLTAVESSACVLYRSKLTDSGE